MSNSRFAFTGRLLAALLVVVLLALMASLTACGGDLAGEPPVVATLPPRATTPPTQDVDVPFSLDMPEIGAGTEFVPPAGSAADEQAPAMPPANAGDETLGVFSGLVTNASSGGPVNEGQRVLLYVVNERFEEDVLETTTGPDGRYRFEDVPVRRGWHYLVSVQYGDGFFTGGMIAGTPSNPDADMPVSVFDVTDDPTVIVIDDLLTQVIPVQEGLLFVQIFRFSNTSDRLYLSGDVIDETRNASVRVTLPAGAQVTAFEDERRYVLSGDGRTVLNTQPVFPGDRHIIHVSYILPDNGTVRVDQPLHYRLSGPVQIIAPEALRINAPQLTTGAREVINGNTFRTYSGSLSLEAGAALQYTVSRSGSSGAVDATTLLAALLAGLGTLALLGAFMLYWRSQQANRPPQAAPAGVAPSGDTASVDIQTQIDDLVTQIADLDSQYRAGEVSAAVYQERRGQFKARLTTLMREKE